MPVLPLVLIAVGVLAISTAAFFRVSLLPDIGAALAMSPTELGLFATMFAVGRLVTDLPAGHMSDRVLPGHALAAAGFVMFGGSLLLAAAPAMPYALGAAFLLGISSSLANTTGMTYFATSVPRASRGRSLALFGAGLLGGQALGPALAGLLSLLGGWRVAEVGAALIGLAAAIGFVLFARSVRRGPDHLHALGLRTELTAIPHPFPVRERFVLFSIAFVGFFSLGSIPQTLVPIIGADDLRLSATAIGLALGLGGLCRFLGSTISGIVSDRVSRKAALVPGLTITATGVGLLAVDAGTRLWLTAIVLMSLGSVGIGSAAVMLADRTHTAVGRRFGAFRLTGDLGLLVGPLVATILFQHVGRSAAILTVTGLLVACAAAAVLIVSEPDWS